MLKRRSGLHCLGRSRTRLPTSTLADPQPHPVSCCGRGCTVMTALRISLRIRRQPLWRGHHPSLYRGGDMVFWDTLAVSFDATLCRTQECPYTCCHWRLGLSGLPITGIIQDLPITCDVPGRTQVRVDAGSAFVGNMDTFHREWLFGQGCTVALAAQSW